MGISLEKSNGISLKKGSSIRLQKEGRKLEQICVGVNWGKIHHTGLWKVLLGKNRVDLDVSLTMFDGRGKVFDTVYFAKLRSRDGAVLHSGDDREGDEDGDDGLDNEVITIHLKKVDPRVEQIVIYLNSYKKQDFADVPYSKIRIYEGTPTHVISGFAHFDLSADPSYAGHIAMVMGKLTRKDGDWEFQTIGVPIKARNIEQTIGKIKGEFL